MSTHNTVIPILISFGGNEIEIEAAVKFGFTPGAPPTGPTYSSGGEPGYGPEVEIEEVELTVSDSSVVGGILKLPAPGWMCDLMHNSDDVRMQLLDAVPDDDGPDPDDARDDRMERNL